MKKHIISILVLFLLVSTSFVGVSNQVTDDSFMVQQDSYQYMIDWSVHLTNQTPSEEASRPYYNYVESGYMEPSPLSGPMDSAWPMQSHDLYHTGRSPYSTANVTGNELWRIPTDNYGSMFMNEALIGNDGTIYFGSSSADAALYSLYPNGTRKWRYQADGNIWGTPAMTEDGTIVFTTWGGEGYTHAVKPDGTLLWKKKIGGHSSASSVTIAKDGTIYFGNDDKNIYAVYPNGTLKWSYPTGYIVLGAPAIGDDGTIYEGSGDYYLYALNPNGTLRWKYQTGDYIKGSVTIAPDGTLYVPSFDGYFHTLNTNGTLLWKGYSGDHLAARGLALAEDGTIYIGTELLRAYYPNGTLKWQTDVQGEIYNTVPAVSADGTIYVTAGAALVAVNPDGGIKWRTVITSEQIYSSPSIGLNGYVYVGSQYHDPDVHGTMHAFGPLDPNAPIAPTITGQTHGKIKTTYDYTFTSSSPLGNQIYYSIDWGDGMPTDWVGPYNSGEIIMMKHSWTEKGTYTIKARARDTDNLWGPWGELQITMPYSYEPQFPFIQWLLERFPHAFPILRYLLRFR